MEFEFKGKYIKFKIGEDIIGDNKVLLKKEINNLIKVLDNIGEHNEVLLKDFIEDLYNSSEVNLDGKWI